MKPLIMFFSMLVCVFHIHSCYLEPDGPKEVQPPAADKHEKKGAPSADTVEITGTVIYVNIEGGFFAILGDDGTKYNPINLPEAFRKDGLKIKALVQPHPDAMSLQMFGSTIEMIDIVAQ